MKIPKDRTNIGGIWEEETIEKTYHNGGILQLILLLLQQKLYTEDNLFCKFHTFLQFWRNSRDRF